MRFNCATCGENCGQPIPERTTHSFEHQFWKTLFFSQCQHDFRKQYRYLADTNRCRHTPIKNSVLKCKSALCLPSTNRVNKRWRANYPIGEINSSEFGGRTVRDFRRTNSVFGVQSFGAHGQTRSKNKFLILQLLIIPNLIFCYTKCTSFVTQIRISKLIYFFSILKLVERFTIFRSLVLL